MQVVSVATTDEEGTVVVLTSTRRLPVEDAEVLVPPVVPGTSLGRYLLIETLGRGGMGKVAVRR
jgi:hypothetical protein